MEFCNLKWSKYESTITSSFTEAYYKKEFCDATIVCNGKQYAVHRLILSLGSNYFKNIFSKTPCSEPLIIIDGIENLLLEEILLFVYSGKIYIHKDFAASFLKAAKFLQIKGLNASLFENYSYFSSQAFMKICNEDDDDCDFPGFSSTENWHMQLSSLRVLKDKLNAIKDIKEPQNIHLQNTIINGSPTNVKGKVFAGLGSRNSNYKFKKRVSNTDKKRMDYLAEKSHKIINNANMLQPVENYNNNCLRNILNNENFVSLHKNIYTKANPFVPLERLTDSVINAANKGYKIWPDDITNLGLDYSQSVAKVSSVEITKLDYSNLFAPKEKEISGALEGVADFHIENMENINKNISTSLRRMKQCAYCHFKTKSRSAIHRHLRNHEVAESKMALTKHQFIKHPAKNTLISKVSSYKCGVPTIMKKHERLLEVKKLFQCSICQFSSQRQSIVLNHKKQCHLMGQVSYKNIASQFINEICLDMSDSAQSSCLTATYNKKLAFNFKKCKSFKCQYCTYTSTSKSALKGHEAYHTCDEEPFKCCFCPYKSAIRTLVKCHEMTHVM